MGYLLSAVHGCLLICAKF